MLALTTWMGTAWMMPEPPDHDPLPPEVRRYAPWTWSPRRLAFPLLIATWIAALCVHGTTFTILEEWPIGSPVLFVPLVLLYYAGTLWFLAAPVVAVMLALLFVQTQSDYSHSEICKQFSVRVIGRRETLDHPPLPRKRHRETNVVVALLVRVLLAAVIIGAMAILA
ncbi:MAG TPA: hypothetical protein VM165_21380 [Planctomycetaceae bacterium]|nr:hypothetical protein [Planctomycetaceae bacterium]